MRGVIIIKERCDFHIAADSARVAKEVLLFSGLFTCCVDFNATPAE